MYRKPVSLVPTPILIETPPSARKVVSFKDYQKRRDVTQSLDTGGYSKSKDGILRRRVFGNNDKVDKIGKLRSLNPSKNNTELKYKTPMIMQNKYSGRDARAKWLDKVQPNFMALQDPKSKVPKARSLERTPNFGQNLEKSSDKFIPVHSVQQSLKAHNVPLPTTNLPVDFTRFKNKQQPLKPSRTQSHDRFRRNNRRQPAVNGSDEINSQQFMKPLSTGGKRPNAAKNRSRLSKFNRKKVSCDFYKNY